MNLLAIQLLERHCPPRRVVAGMVRKEEEHTYGLLCSATETLAPPLELRCSVHDPEEGQEVTAGSVQLVYFHIANPCSCMAVFGGAIADSINTNFQTELASGELKFIDVVSDDAANKEIVEAFDSQPSDLFVVTTIGDAISVEPDYDIWSLMGDNEAVAQYVKGVVEAKLAGLNS